MLPCANDFRKADKFKGGIKIVLTYIFDPFILMLSIIKGLRCLKPFSCISIREAGIAVHVYQQWHLSGLKTETLVHLH